MKISIAGTGYVGLVTGVSLSVLGHEVICIGRDKNKIKEINNGESPFYEPGLSKLLKKVIKEKKLIATDDFEKSIINSEIIIIAVGTPTVNKKIDLSFIKKVSEQIGKSLKKVHDYKVIVVKSTVVPGTTEDIVKPIIEKYSQKKVGQFGLCMNPEFLREGQAVEDALNPDRIVVGAFDKKSANQFLKIYKKIKSPKLVSNLKTAEMTKYASNALFATLISYANEIARICEKSKNIDAFDVWEGVHLDKRLTPLIGKKRIKPGVLSFILSGCGYGGSCFPKDTKALINYASSIGEEASLVKQVVNINQTQPKRMVDLLKQEIGSLKNKKISLMGLSFKPDTDDIRESPALTIVNLLMKEQAKIYCHDPMVYKHGAPKFLGELNIILCKNIHELLKESEGALLITSWNEYKDLSPQKFIQLMGKPLLIDGRRIYDKKLMLKSGVLYKAIGLS